MKKQKWSFCLATILSLCTVTMTRMHSRSGEWGTIDLSGTIEENYFSKFGISAIFLFIICLLIFSFLIIKSDDLLKKAVNRICPDENTEEHISIKIGLWSVVIVIAWLPYWLSYYPGGIYSDTFTSISYSMSGVLTNRHPFLYNILIDWAIKCGNYFGKNITWSMGLFLSIQMLLLEIEIIYFFYWMTIHRINKNVRTCVMLFMIFFPLIPLYAVSIWKDTPFCMAFMLWMMFLVDLYLNIQKNQWNIKTLLGFMGAGLLVGFTRNNGIYVIIFSVVVFVVTTLKDKFEKKRIIYGFSLLLIIMTVFIQGPVYQWIGVEQTDKVENLAVPLQQICSVVAYDGEITEEQKESINRFVPYDNIKTHFTPCLVDHIKWEAGMDDRYLSEHMKEFLDLWIHLLIQNPDTYIKEYLLLTSGFWNVDITARTAYVQNFVWNNSYEVIQTDYFERWFGFSFQHFVNPRSYISGAWFFWIFFVCMIFVIKHYGWRKIWLFAPQFGIWLTLMIATPIAVSLRYIAALVFTIPFVVLIPLLLERENESN